MAWHSFITKYFSPFSRWSRQRRNWTYLGPRRQSAGVAPNGSDIVFGVNGTTLEITSGSPSEYRGMMVLGFGPMGVLAGGCVFLILDLVISAFAELPIWFIALMIFGASLATVMCILGVLAALSSFFAYAGAPVRFDRKHRKVYAFQTNRRQLEFDWDRVKLVTEATGGMGDGHYFCNLLLVDEDENGKVVWEGKVPKVVILGDVQHTPKDAAAIYEFVRLFMEEGPQALPRCDSYRVYGPEPRDLVRSSGLLNFVRTWPQTPAREKSWTTMIIVIVLGVLLSPLFFAVDAVSYIANCTSRIPKWLPHIEATAVEGGPMRPPPGAASMRRGILPHEWPFIILWVGSAFAFYVWGFHYFLG